ncbi:hypothetical protein [Plasmodium yoelii yoelii]|uniref:Uncharacterized protein n=1 Tax=Plasmodium yoelii yoelii TaxID=73239 RepID=Q7RKS8_PLAYO|nr:hypothetical protein [Plasmodium yoelii yoelii]
MHTCGLVGKYQYEGGCFAHVNICGLTING